MTYTLSLNSESKTTKPKKWEFWKKPETTLSYSFGLMEVDTTQEKAPAQKTAGLDE
jgi:hypothetical protein